MILSILSDIGHKLTEIGLEIRDFFLDNSRNPFLWVAIIIVVLVIFEVVYKKLHRD